MKPEASGVGTSIPRTPVSVKRVLSGLLDGLPVTSTDYGLNLVSAITVSEIEVVVRKLEVVERDVMVPSRFKRGDVWLQLHAPDFFIQRIHFLAGVKMRMPDPDVRRRYLSALSGYGAVAKMWPVEKRVGGHCWSYYRDNPPGTQEPVAHEEAVLSYRSVGWARRNDECVLTLRSARGKAARLLLTREELEMGLALVNGEMVTP